MSQNDFGQGLVTDQDMTHGESDAAGKGPSYIQTLNQPSNNLTGMQEAKNLAMSDSEGQQDEDQYEDGTGGTERKNMSLQNSISQNQPFPENLNDPKMSTQKGMDIDPNQDDPSSPEPSSPEPNLQVLQLQNQLQAQESPGLRDEPVEIKNKRAAPASDAKRDEYPPKAMGVEINKKHLHGGGHPDKMSLRVNQMVIDPDETMLDELGNPLDYFNIYKRKMQELAHERFDQEKDMQFFSYLDRLVNADEYLAKDRINGMAILKEFITDKGSLSYVKRRNDQIRRWEYHRQKRIEDGLPADAPTVDPAYLNAMLLKFQNQMNVKAVPQKAFHPEFDEGNNLKNFIASHRFGGNRDYRPPWEDPNPVKYGGKYGMQHMKEMIDTGYMTGKREHARRQDMERKARMTKEEREEEQRKIDEAKLLAEQSRAKLTDLDGDKQYGVDKTLHPSDRSFLIQPEKKSLKARMPSIFSLQSPSVLQATGKSGGKLSQMKGTHRSGAGQSGRILNNQTTHKYLNKVDTIGTFDSFNNADIINASNSNQSFMMAQNQNQQNAAAFGKRSFSMASPNMSGARNYPFKGQSQDHGDKMQSQSFFLADDPSRQALDQYKTMLQQQGSSKHLLTKIQSEYSNLQTVNAANDQKATNNLENIKNQFMEPNVQIMNPPIKEDYDHKSFSKAENVEATIKLSIALEDIRNNPHKYGKLIGLKGQKFKYQIRHGRISPTHLQEDEKLKLFEVLANDMQSASTQRKQATDPRQTFRRDESQEGAGDLSLRKVDSMLSSKSKSTKEKDIFSNLWQNPYHVIFVKDGSKMADPKTKSIKCDISKFIRKYLIEPPKFIAKMPMDYIESQRTFFDRAYMEIIDYCQSSLNPLKKEEDLEIEPELKALFTSDGKPLLTIADLQEYLYLRRRPQSPPQKVDEIMQSEGAELNAQVSLPPIAPHHPYGSVGLINRLNSLNVQSQDTILPNRRASGRPDENAIQDTKVINKQKKAQFVSYHSTEKFEIAPQQSLSQLSGQQGEDSPPLILVSWSDKEADFKGIELANVGLTNQQLRTNNAHQVKDMIAKQKSQWGSKQFLDWIERNVHSGRSGTKNMESILQKDTQKKYANTNDQYRQQILNKLNSTSQRSLTEEKLMKPVYIGGGLNQSSKFLLPIVEEGGLTNLRRRFRNQIEEVHSPAAVTGLQLDFSSKYLQNSSQQYLDLDTQRSQMNENESIMHRDGSKTTIYGKNQWKQEYIDKVEQLKQVYISKDKASKTDRNHRIVPIKKNFEALSQQQSQENIGTASAQFINPVLDKQSSISASMKKIAINLNLNLDEKMEERLAKSLQKKPHKPEKQPYISKNIPHLNLDKKKIKKKINFEEINRMSHEFNLPVPTIYTLQTEFQGLVDIKDHKENMDLKILGGQSKQVEAQNEKKEVDDDDDEIDPQPDGVPATLFMENFHPLKEKNKDIVGKIMAAFGITKILKQSINLRQYMHFNSILKYYSARPETFLDFWMKFFNPYNQGEIPKDQIVQNLELLARGRLTKEKTIISESFALGFYKMLKNKKCCITGLTVEVVDMHRFKAKLADGTIDLDYLNQCLRSDSEFSMDQIYTEEPSVDEGSKSGKDQTLTALRVDVSSREDSL